MHTSECPRMRRQGMDDVEYQRFDRRNTGKEDDQRIALDGLVVEPRCRGRVAGDALPSALSRESWSGRLRKTSTHRRISWRNSSTTDHARAQIASSREKLASAAGARRSTKGVHGQVMSVVIDCSRQVGARCTPEWGARQAAGFHAG